ncbi:phosphonate metabolism protein/1,5-bisphosphokinase (PRPP-forming) PhnN [Oceaniovalibus sp. ACAM 378]|uniref:phosphonate metabolism protein/1,5-bisphosphokinase (PRPP-forming) PhnN n=1 Tax=Oceaniovalibus sp. ACAM 378 TaxID=2599923 RepID=UPI0011DC437C|nr:phosphonate metabolism protein/1,5-bisphosphokinase (PRPP-forming) PhnN [Oceaniovalibus sp. ACAM 378]TYB86651.1 phosphonate metabolism protein/1,5-bisphosphokinase (PRPP-forming) PhnN [Oceaniovalibus sp. ACAM 378]
MSGRFIAVVGPSGVGKDSVMQGIAARDPRIVLARRVITRPGDAGGEDFDGVTVAEFQALEDAHAFALSWEAHGLHYAIPAAIKTHLQDGRDVLANLSRAALILAKDRFARFEVINLTADHDVLAARLAARGRETDKQIAGRLDRAAARLPDGIEALHLDNSGPLEQTVQAALDRLYPVRA